MHIVLDTNVLLSAVVRPTQLPGRLLASLRVREGGCAGHQPLVQTLGGGLSTANQRGKPP